MLHRSLSEKEKNKKLQEIKEKQIKVQMIAWKFVLEKQAAAVMLH